MTEYDYSPEAYERYMNTQHRITQWVDNTEAHRPEFGADAHYLADPALHGQRPGHSRQNHSMRDVPRYHRRPSFSSSSSSSEPPKPPHSFETTPAPGSHPLYRGMQPLAHDAQRPSPHRQTSSRHHRPHRSHIQTYVVSPHPSSPVQTYPYAYNVNTGSPGPYGFHGKGSNGTSQATATAASYFPPSVAGYYMPAQATYPFPQPMHHQPSKSAPVSSYSIYAPPNPPQPAAYVAPQYQSPHAAYPPTIYPLMPVGPGYSMQSAPQQGKDSKPLFYRKIFGKSRSKSSRRSS